MEPCRSAFEAEPEAWESARCFYSNGRSFDLVEEATENLTTLRRAHPDSGPIAMALGYFAEDRYLRSREPADFDAAAGLFRGSAKGYSRAGDSLGEIRSFYNLWRLFKSAGRLEEAVAFVTRGLEIAEHSSDPVVRLEAALLAADHGLGTGVGLGRCREHLKDAYGAFPKPDPDHLDPGLLRLQGRTLNKLVALSSRLNRLEEHLEASRELVLVAAASGSRTDALSASYNMALVQSRFFRRGEETRADAIEWFQRVIEGAGDQPLDAVAYSHLELGQLLEGEEGRGHLERCLEISRELGADKETACLFALAEEELSRNPDAARRSLRQALELMEGNREPYLTLRAWPLYFKLAWETLPREEALAMSFEVLDAIEAQWVLQQRDAATDEYASATFLGEWSEAYHRLSGKLLSVVAETGDEALQGLAFEISERMRGRVLLDALRLSAIASEAPLAETALAREREANFALVARLKILLLAMTRPSAVMVDEPVLLRSHPDVVRLRKTRDLLGDHQALLSFQFMADKDIYGRFAGGSWVTVVRRSGIETFRLPSARKLRSQLRFFRSGVAAGNEDPGRTEWLYDQLLAEALESLPESIEHLILVPDGELYGLPFAALKGSEDDLPLGARFALSTVPSATLWSRWHRGEEERPPAVVLAFADPDQDHAPEVLASISKEPAALPRARREGRRLTRLFGGASRLATGKEATEAFLRSADLDPFGLLHFATHTVVDHETPDRSAVILAAGSGEEDGLLRPSEIAGLALDERLVVLSACDTASGEILRGEGVMGLARAFFVAGARTVVGTLWPVEDGDAERFFVGFYDRLFEGQSVSEAVRGTQDELWRAGAPAQAWAGIVVLGGGELALPPGSRTTPARWWLWALLLVGVGLLLWIGRRPRLSGA